MTLNCILKFTFVGFLGFFLPKKTNYVSLIVVGVEKKKKLSD